MVSAILLAAGESKRMGKRDKRFLQYQGRPLVEHVLDQIRQSQAGEVIVVCNGQDDDRLRTFQSERIQIVVNSAFRQGMTTSIQAGIRVTSPDTQGYMICLADQPLLQPTEYTELIKAFETAYQRHPQSMVVPFYEGKKGNPVIFSAHYRAAILAHKEMDGCKEIVQANRLHLVPLAMPTPHILVDVDTPEDYAGLG